MSEQFCNQLKRRKEYLENLIKAKEKSLESAPAGRLRTSSAHGSTSFYCLKGPKDTSGKYLPKKDMQFIRALAQKDYDRKILKSGKAELETIDILINLQDKSVEDVYESLSLTRQTLINPIKLPDSEYIAHWLESKKCEPMGFGEADPVILTAEGYRVRSKSEQLWADLMEDAGVPHVFEPQIYLEGHGWIRPDFAGLNVRKRKEIVIEHFGMMDDPAYAEKNVDKLHDYERNGFVLGDDLLITMETKKFVPERKSIEELIKRHFL